MKVLLDKRTYCREYILLIKRGVLDAFFPFISKMVLTIKTEKKY